MRHCTTTPFAWKISADFPWKTMTVYRHRIPESWGGWRGLYNYLPFDVCEVSGQGYNGSPNGEHGEKHMNFWCTIWHNLMGFKFDFSLFPILRRECRDGNSRGWPFIHECGLGSAQPCLVIFASKSPGGGEPACDRKWCGLILNWWSHFKLVPITSEMGY